VADLRKADLTEANLRWAKMDIGDRIKSWFKK